MSDYGYGDREDPPRRSVPSGTPPPNVRQPAGSQPRATGRQAQEGVRREIHDHQNPPVTRVIIGKLGPNPEDYGIQVWDANGDLVLSASGEVGLVAGTLTSTTGKMVIDLDDERIQVFDGSGVKRLELGDLAAGTFGMQLWNSAGAIILDEQGQIGAALQYLSGNSVDAFEPAETGAEQTAGKSLSVLTDLLAQYIDYASGTAVEDLEPSEANAKDNPPSISPRSVSVFDSGTDDEYSGTWDFSSKVDSSYDVTVHCYREGVHVGQTTVTATDGSFTFTDTGAGDGSQNEHKVIFELRDSSGTLQQSSVVDQILVQI